MDLPEVTQAWEADVGPYVAAMGALIDATARARDAAVADMAAIQAAIDGIHGGDLNIDVNAAGLNEMAAGARTAAAAEENLAHAADDTTRATYEETVAADALIRADLAAAAAAEARAAAQRDLAEQARVDMLMEDLLAQGINDVTVHDQDWISTQKVMAQAAASTAKAFALRNIEARAAADADKAFGDVEATLAAEAPTASNALRGIIGAMQGSTQATRIFGLSLSALHWIVGVSAEALAVLLPAIIAFGAGLDVAMQGAVNAGAHMEALWTAAEATNSAFGQTLGTLLHLKPALQEAQDAANPGVYEILGSAVNDAKAHMDDLATAGLEVVHMWDEFSARITVDMQTMAKSGEMQSLLGNMVGDLQELGQVFGNVGHAILNFAADMPGLAEVLLMIVDDISKVILWISELPHNFILVAMALEEFYRWGGLAASIISRIGLLLPMLAGAVPAAAVGIFGRLAAIMGSVVGVGSQLAGGLATVAGGISKVIPAASGAEKALSGMSETMASAASDTALMGVLGLTTAVIVGEVFALNQLKDSTQRWIASSNQAVAAASDMKVIPEIYSQMTQTADRLQASTSELGTAATLNGTRMGAAAGEVSGDYTALQGHLESLIGTYHTVTTNVSQIASAFHVTGAAAMVLAQEAGVNLKTAFTKGSEGARIAYQQIQNLLTGLGAMGAPAGVVGNDMEALGIQSQLAGTKVSQLNQAWDAWISSVTGSMADFAQVETAIGTMAQDSAAKSAALSGSIGSVSLAAGNVKYSLQGMSQGAMQSWQQFTSAVGTGEQALDQLRTGMAEGVVSAGQFGSTVRGLIGQLIPFAAGNKTAVEILSNLAHEAGGPVTTSLQQLAQWTGVKGKAAGEQFAQGMNKASQEMGNMSAAAQNLSAVVSSDLNTAMAQAILNVTKIAPLTQAYVGDLQKYGANATVTKNALATLNGAEREAQKLTQQAGNAAQTTAAQLHREREAALELAKALTNIPTHVQTDIVTNYVSTGYSGPGGVGHRVGAHGGMVTGTGIIPSFAGGGALPGFSPGVDNILAALSPGEGVLTPYAMRMIGGAPALNWLNSMAEHGSAPGGGATGGGGAGGGGEMVNHVHVYLDGQKIWDNMQQRTLSYNTRNSGSRTGAWAPGR